MFPAKYKRGGVNVSFSDKVNLTVQNIRSSLLNTIKTGEITVFNIFRYIFPFLMASSLPKEK